MEAPTSLILISCSHAKRQGGEPFGKTTAVRTILSENLPPASKSRLVEMRKHVLSLLQGKNGRLYNSDQGGGYRDLREENSRLVLGPDFGAADPGGPLYLPAYKRYRGRFFTKVRRAPFEFWNSIGTLPIEVLVMSGLYGLLFWDEPIQEYDCHLADEVKWRVFNGTLANYWKPLMTEVLCGFINARKGARAPIHDVFDLLSDEIYQDALDWEQIRNQTGVRIHHRDFRPPLLGTDTLPAIAQILTVHLNRFYEDKRSFKNGEWVELSSEPGSIQKFRLDYHRPTELAKAFELVCLTYPDLRTLPDEVSEQLASAELSRRASEHIRGFDRGVLVGSYTKCIEIWLGCFEVGWEARFDRSPRNVVGKLPKYRPLVHDVNELWEIRNPQLHGTAKAAGDTSASALKRARDLVIKILTAAERIRLT